MNTEQIELFRRMEDLATRCAKQSSVTVGSFLTPAEQVFLRSFPLRDEVRLMLAGGGENSERRAPFFLPWYEESADEAVEEHIRAVHIKSYFGTAQHRDYLGAILALGIRREWVGDIQLSGEDCWVFALASVEPVIRELSKVGRVSVKCESVPLSAVPPLQIDTKEVRFTVKSLRADAVTGELFSLSRTAAAEKIRLGELSLNYSVCTKVDAEIREGDVLSLRGYGKGSVTEVGGKSKKDRLFITAQLRK